MRDWGWFVIIQKTRGLIGLPNPEEELRQLEEQGNISVYTDRQAKANQIKAEAEVELSGRTKVLKEEEESRVALAAEVKAHSGSIGAVKKDIEDVELAITKVE